MWGELVRKMDQVKRRIRAVTGLATAQVDLALFQAGKIGVPVPGGRARGYLR